MLTADATAAAVSASTKYQAHSAAHRTHRFLPSRRSRRRHPRGYIVPVPVLGARGHGRSSSSIKIADLSRGELTI